MKLLITDADQRSSLAVTRSLGKKGVEVIAADHGTSALSAKSKYCAGFFTYPSPYDHPDMFCDALHDEIVKRHIEIIFPMTDVTTYLILMNKARYEDHARIPFPSFDAYSSLTDKHFLFNTAQQLGIPCPETVVVDSQNKPMNDLADLHFPLVVRPNRSHIYRKGTWTSMPVRYASNLQELEVIINDERYQDITLLVQEHIMGQGSGVFSIFNNGKPIGFFAHKRLREKPPTGGVSVLRESIPVDQEMKNHVVKLLSHLNWHGVAMVEFKVDEKTGISYLIEVNGRLWGSLQLAIDAGVDFPYLLFQMALGELSEQPVTHYKTGVRSRWMLGDLDHLYIRLTHELKYLSPRYPSKLKCIMEFLKLYEKNTKYEVESFSDPGPWIYEVKEYIRQLFK